MNIKAIINAFEKDQKNIQDQMSILTNLFEKEDKLWEYYEKLNPSIFLNEKLMNFFADSLHVVNNEDRLDEYELADIQRIYELLCEHYPDNIQYQEDLIAFVYNVMDDENQALLLIDKAMKNIDEKRRYFRKISNQIKEDKKTIK